MESVKKTGLLVVLFFMLGFCLKINPTLARENVTDWYIQNFDTKIIVNADSTLDVTERITADCGNASGKHGIFRILPEEVKITGMDPMKIPVELLSITDFNGKKIPYSESRNSSDKTVTWKIGDADKTVQGVNNYEIRYRVKNVIRFFNNDFDEFYWNLNGNFWDLETDKFHAAVVFPESVTAKNSQVDYYTGLLGSKSKSLATYKWSSDNVLEFDSSDTLKIGEGITVSVIFPKNIFTPFKFGFLETYGHYFFLLLPIIAFFTCFHFWKKYGKDPKVDKAIVPEYEAPGNLTPMELGMLKSNGTFSNDLVTAEIINLACKGLMTIKETNNKVILFNLKDYILIKKHNEEKEKLLNEPQRKILNKIFDKGSEVELSDLKTSFYTVLKDVESKAKEVLEKKGLLSKTGSTFSSWFVVLGIIIFIFSIFSFAAWEANYLGLNLLISGVIVFLFGLAMPQRTPAGAELNWQIKGFKMFMETVDKDRAKFYEEQNIFEKFLPFAIVFGITELWIKKMKEIYGEEYFTTHAPVWYVGSNMASFNAESFSSAISSLSSDIASNTSSPSGSGGSGGSGGGGGGGGGGGW
ncbi:MAG TPA: DUF2207 domain-containing protein [Candidatus Moranbacteria bacterium]|nr:DUF2207 domain-containing protein [Candidatus Moranbacteria bacterium]